MVVKNYFILELVKLLRNILLQMYKWIDVIFPYAASFTTTSTNYSLECFTGTDSVLYYSSLPLPTF